MRFRHPIAFLFATSLLAQNNAVIPEQYYRTFSHTNPVLRRIKTGEVVVTKTLDSSGFDERNQPKSPGSNPLTGPFYVEGAEAGDALAVTLRRVRLNRNWGYSAYRLGLFSLSADYVESTYPNHYKPDLVRKGRDNILPWDIDLAHHIVHLREPVSSRVKLEFPARPMLGCIGVAAAGDFAPTSAPSGNYGGNLDYNEIGEGATIILPVFHTGGFLFLGDG